MSEKQEEQVKIGYPAHKNHEIEWGNEHDSNTVIGHAWRRMYDRGIHVGRAMSSEYKREVNEGTQKRPHHEHTIFQQFMHATAEYNEHPENKNKMVVFHDARGIVGTESGLSEELPEKK